MLPELLGVFGLVEPISTVVEFLIVIAAIGFGYDFVKKFNVKSKV